MPEPVGPASPPAPSAPATPITIDGHDLIGIAEVPDGVQLRLVQRGEAFAILLDRTELMSTRVSHSEESLATMTCARLTEKTAPDLLIGGYGMGYTLRAALAVLGAKASVTVAEIVPEIVTWARGPMAKLTAGCLDDPRVLLVNDDVAMLIDAAKSGYDAILLDVDNGPEGITRLLNDNLYTNWGLAKSMAALKPGGVLAIWSAGPSAAFTKRLNAAGFLVDEVKVRSRPNNKGAHHTIWFAQKPKAGAALAAKKGAHR